MSADASEGGCDWYFGVPFPSKRKAAAVKERELKVGDRVRVVTHGKLPTGSYHNARVGDVFTLQSFSTPTIGMGFWRTNGPDFYPHEIELIPTPPTFPSGTRVRLKRHVHRFAAGDMGTVTTSNDENVGVRMDEGRYWAFKPEDLVVVPAPWGNPARDCAGRNGEQGEPKFKAGDVVRCLRGYDGQFTKDALYTVREFPNRHGHVGVMFDDGSRTNNGLHPDRFELVTSAPCPQDNEQTSWNVTIDKDTGYITGLSTAQPCIVMRLENGQPRPSSWPHVHQSAADATREAERLASVNPGKQFDVYQRVTGRVGDVQVREVA